MSPVASGTTPIHPNGVAGPTNTRASSPNPRATRMTRSRVPVLNAMTSSPGMSRIKNPTASRPARRWVSTLLGRFFLAVCSVGARSVANRFAPFLGRNPQGFGDTRQLEPNPRDYPCRPPGVARSLVQLSWTATMVGAKSKMDRRFRFCQFSRELVTNFTSYF